MIKLVQTKEAEEDHDQKIIDEVTRKTFIDYIMENPDFEKDHEALLREAIRKRVTDEYYARKSNNYSH